MLYRGELFHSLTPWLGSFNDNKAMGQCNKRSSSSLAPGPGGYSWEFLVEVCARFSKSWPFFRPKKCQFPHPFTDLACKIRILFQTWRSSQNATYDIHSHNYLENRTRLHPKMSKFYTRFQSKTARKPYPSGWHETTVNPLSSPPLSNKPPSSNKPSPPPFSGEES